MVDSNQRIVKKIIKRYFGSQHTRIGIECLGYRKMKNAETLLIKQLKIMNKQHINRM